LKNRIAPKVTSRDLEQLSSVLKVHPLQYFESEIRRAMDSDMINDTVAIAPPWVIISIGKNVCVFDSAAIMLIILFLLKSILSPHTHKYET